VASLAVYGNYIISGSGDSTIKIWKLDTGAYVRTIGTSKYNDSPWSLGPDCIISVAVYEEGSAHRIVSASRDHTIKIWDLKSGNCLYTLAGPNGHTDPVTSVAIRKTPDGGCLIVSGSVDRTVKIWHTKSIDELCNWYRIKYEQLLYPNYEATFPQDLTPFCSELQTVLSDVRLKAKSLFPLHLLFHKFVYLDNEYTYDLLDILLDINRI
jgi:WD40 repeat protein